MKLIPLLYKPMMVQATLKKWKTNTRRLKGLEEINEHPDAWEFDTFILSKDDGKLYAKFKRGSSGIVRFVKCPYGNIGDVLWVRENFYKHKVLESLFIGYKYEADNEIDIDKSWAGWKKKPSIHMPFVACRIFLKVTGIKVERLKDISEADAIAEGIYRWKDADDYFNYVRSLKQTDQIQTVLRNEDAIRKDMDGQPLYKEYIHSIFVPSEAAVINNPVVSFIGLFLGINKPQKNMDLDHPLNNPWVWAISFEVISTTGNPDPSIYQIGKKIFQKNDEKYSNT